MGSESNLPSRRSSGRALRALAVSVSFPAITWFFGSRVGLAAGVAAVAVWWTASHPRIICWGVCILCLLATPIAVWAQGLPASSIVGADFGVRHWIANDLVIVGLVFGSFAAVIELSGLDLQRRRSTVLLRLAATLAARVEPPREPGPASATSTPSASEPRDQGA